MAMLCKHKRSIKWYRRKQKNKGQMLAWSKKGNVNLKHMILLLEAEEYALKKRVDMQLARSKFDAAIARASQVGDLSDNALGCERAGVFCLKRGDSYWARVYLVRAYERYVIIVACSLPIHSPPCVDVICTIPSFLWQVV